MNYTEEDLDKALDELLIQRGEHPTRVRNPLYGEERELAKSLVKLFAIPAVMATLPSDEEIKQQMTTDHYCHDKGHYRKIRLDRIQGGKMIRDLIKQRIEGNLP